MTAEQERIAALELRVAQLEAKIKSSKAGPFLRAVYDERGRASIVTLGGNNGGY